MERTFTEALNEYLELKKTGPNESSGYTDKDYWKRLNELAQWMDKEVALARKLGETLKKIGVLP